MHETMKTDASIYLRPLTEEDLDRCHRWHNDSVLYATLVDGFRQVSRTAEREWLAKRLAHSTGEVNLAICLAPGGEHIGNIYLRPIDLANRRAVLGVLIGEEAQRGKGYGRQAIELVLEHAFKDLGLERVHLEVLANNARAIRVYERAGFRTEGRLRQHVFKSGRFQDVLVMGLLRSEFAAAASKEEHA